MTPDQEIESKLVTYEYRGQKRYRCPVCEFDSYKVVNVIKHWSESHFEATKSLPGVTLFDAKGKRVSNEETSIVVPDEEIVNQMLQPDLVELPVEESKTLTPKRIRRRRDRY
jgi:hypothetical protein